MFVIVMVDQFRREPNGETVNEVRPVLVGQSEDERDFLQRRDVKRRLFGPLYTGGCGTAWIDRRWLPCCRLVSVTREQGAVLCQLAQQLWDQMSRPLIIVP